MTQFSEHSPRDVKYLVIGGYAVAFHGHPRYTKDIDFWIWLEESNATRMITVLNDFGFSSLGIKKKIFSIKIWLSNWGILPIELTY